MIKKIMKPQKGFSLVEMLLALAIMMIVSIVLVIMLSRFVELFFSDDEQVLAKQRGMDVIKMLEVPVLHTALGIPANIPGDPDRKDVFQRTFTDTGPNPKKNPPFLAWGSPLLISGIKSDDLRILYGIESGVFQKDEDRNVFSSSSLVTKLSLTKPLNPAYVSQSNPQLTYGWITFPGQMLPMMVKSGLNTASPDVEARRKSIQTAKYDEKLNAFGEVLYLQARRVWVDSDDVFHLMEVLNSDVIGSGPELTVPGVLRIQFNAIENNHVLSVNILTRGDTSDDAHEKRLRDSRPELINRWGITSDEAKFVLEETSIQWRIRNYETE